MFKKVPYGVKVRVRGKPDVGYTAEVCISYSRFSLFPNIWTPISHTSARAGYIFKSLEEAQYAAMCKYDSWIEYYKRDEETSKALKTVPKGTVWEHP